MDAKTLQLMALEDSIHQLIEKAAPLLGLSKEEAYPALAGALVNTSIKLHYTKQSVLHGLSAMWDATPENCPCYEALQNTKH